MHRPTLILAGVPSAGITGTLNVALGAATLNGQGTVAIGGSSSQTLGAATISAIGTVAVVATLAATLAAAMLSGAGVIADNWYAAPHITSGGAGTLADPWPLSTAITSASVQPGDTVWLRGVDGGGTYKKYEGFFAPSRVGTSGARITIRAYLGPHGVGERVTIDGASDQGDYIAWNPTTGSRFLDFRDLEIMNSNTNRVATEVWRPDVARDGGEDHRFINCIFRDAQVAPQYGKRTEFYGCLVCYSGVYWTGIQDPKNHNIYVSNLTGTGTKKILDSLVFAGFDRNIQEWNDVGEVHNIQVEGCAAWMAGALVKVVDPAHPEPYSENVTVGGGGGPYTGLSWRYVYTYHHRVAPGTNARGGNILYGAGASVESPNIRDNYWWGPDANGAALRKSNWSGTPVVTGNNFYGLLQGFVAGDYPDNTYETIDPQPTGNRIFVRPNSYEAGRGHVIIYNPDLNTSVSVNLSTILSINDTYKVFDAMNPWVAILDATYAGGTVAFPMNLTAVMAPAGISAPEHPHPRFGAFIVQKTGAASPISGTLNVTLASAALTGQGDAAIAGNLDTTLDAAALAGAGTVSTVGTLDTVSAPATLAGIGGVTVQGVLNQVLDATVLSSAGFVPTDLAVSLGQIRVFSGQMKGIVRASPFRVVVPLNAPKLRPKRTH